MGPNGPQWALWALWALWACEQNMERFILNKYWEAVEKIIQHVWTIFQSILNISTIVQKTFCKYLETFGKYLESISGKYLESLSGKYLESISGKYF